MLGKISSAPWMVRCIGYWDNRDQYAIVDVESVTLATIESADRDPENEDSNEDGMVYGEKTKANADLMAAAPELFAVLKQMRDCLTARQEN